MSEMRLMTQQTVMNPERPALSNISCTRRTGVEFRPGIKSNRYNTLKGNLLSLRSTDQCDTTTYARPRASTTLYQDDR